MPSRRKSNKAWRQVLRKEAEKKYGRRGGSIAPEYKAQRTRGRMSGRITLGQYLLLVKHGYDGDKIKAWTNYRAAQEIGKAIKRKQSKNDG